MMTHDEQLSQKSDSEEPPHRKSLFFGVRKSTLFFAFGLGIVAVVSFVLANSYNATLPQTVSYFLGLLSIVASCFAGILVSADQIRDEVRLSHEGRLRSVTSIAATELNNFYQNLSSLNRSWEKIAQQYNVPPSTMVVVSDRLFNMMNILQSSINTVLGLGGSKKNPFNLWNFGNTVQCPSQTCLKDISITALSPFPRAEHLMSCPHCKSNLFVKRRFDGSLTAQFARPDLFSADKSNKGNTPTDSSSPEYPSFSANSSANHFGVSKGANSEQQFKIVKCPNPNCSFDVHIKFASHFTFANRGCPECGESFNYIVSTGIVTPLPQVKSRAIAEEDIIEKNGEELVECDCMRTISTKFLRPNSKGKKYLECRGCGKVLYDINGLFV